MLNFWTWIASCPIGKINVSNVQTGGLQHQYIAEYDSTLIPYIVPKCPQRFLRTLPESHSTVCPGYMV